jgi:hypothetical protein
VQIKCRRKDGAPKKKRLVLLTDLSNLTNISIHNNSFSNNYRALVERLVFHDGQRPIKPSKPFDLKASQRIRQYESIVPRISSQQFVEHYVGSKRKIYTKAMWSLVENPIEHRDSWIKAFVKSEKFDFIKKPDQVPRLIQPRSPRFNLELGRFLQPMEKPIYGEIDKLYGYPVVMKGKNAVERAAVLRQHWEDMHDPVAVGIDAKRFDQHTGRAALKYEHGVYRRHTPRYLLGELNRLLKMQLTTYGTCYTETGNIRYKIPGVRCSGDVNTSLGNIIIMTHLVYDYLESLNITHRFINDGDDGVIIINRCDLARLSGMYDWFSDYGYKMQAEEPVDVFEEIEFCQCRPVWEGAFYIMCRHPIVVINRDAYTTKSVETEGQWNYYRGAIGNCGIACSGGMPVLQNFYAALARGGKNVRSVDTSLGLYWLALGLSRQIREPSSSTRVSFFKAFGITPDEQLILEQRYDRVVPTYRPSGTHQYLSIDRSIFN